MPKNFWGGRVWGYGFDTGLGLLSSLRSWGVGGGRGLYKSLGVSRGRDPEDRNVFKKFIEIRHVKLKNKIIFQSFMNFLRGFGQKYKNY